MIYCSIFAVLNVTVIEKRRSALIRTWVEPGGWQLAPPPLMLESWLRTCIRVLSYFDEVLDQTIRNINYFSFLQVRAGLGMQGCTCTLLFFYGFELVRT
jgi:hypothetical protein